MKLKKQWMYDDELGQKLKELEKELSYASKRFSLLSKVAKSHHIASFYKKTSNYRARYLLNLTRFLNDVNIKSNKKSSVRDAFTLLHTKVKAIFENDEDQVALTKTIYFEESLLLTYASILKYQGNISQELYQLLIEHQTKIRSDIEKMEYLKKFC